MKQDDKKPGQEPPGPEEDRRTLRADFVPYDQMIHLSFPDGPYVRATLMELVETVAGNPPPHLKEFGAKRRIPKDSSDEADAREFLAEGHEWGDDDIQVNSAIPCCRAPDAIWVPCFQRVTLEEIREYQKERSKGPSASGPAESRRCVVLSTRHLPGSVAAWGGRQEADESEFSGFSSGWFFPRPYGYGMTCPASDPPDQPDMAGIEHSVRAMLVQDGMSPDETFEVLFDRDGPVVDFLSTFDW
jgi:hypothetical protein